MNTAALLRVVAPPMSFYDLCRRAGELHRLVFQRGELRLLPPVTTFGYDARIETELAIATPVWKRP